MDDQEVPASSAFPLLIKVLASSRDVDFRTLRDIVRSISSVSDFRQKELREVLALRCLEGVYDHAKVSKCPASSSHAFRFYSGESSVRFIKRILEKASSTMLNMDGCGSNKLVFMRKTASARFANEVQAFVQHKKANLPQFALEESINSFRQSGVLHAPNLEKTNRTEAQSSSPDKTKTLLKEKSATTTPLESEKDVEDGPIDVDCYKSPPRKKLRKDVDLSPAHQTLDVCMACKEGDEVLRTCSVCQTIIHERCLGAPASFDNKGDFMCPICAYSHGFSEYVEAKKKMLVHLERLFLFIGTKFGHGQVDQSNVVSLVNAQSPLQGRDVNGSVKITSASTSKAKESGGDIPRDPVPSKNHDKQTEHCDVGLRSSNPEKLQIHTPTKNATSVDRNGTTSTKTVMPEQGNCSRPQRQSKNQGEEIEAKLADEKDVLSEPINVSDGNVQGKNRRAASRPQHGNRSRPQMSKGQGKGIEATLSDEKDVSSDFHNVSDGNLLGENRRAASRPQHGKFSRPQRQSKSQGKEIEDQLADEKDVSSESHNASDGNLQGKSRRAASNYSLRHQGQPHYDLGPDPYDFYQEQPRIRKPTVLFTEKEVEMLKIGVQKFGPQWKFILNFGSSVFLPCRRAVDLKDKWRNLVHKGLVMDV